MSEYQYYEFLAVDRPLDDKQIDQVRKYSSRAEITATRFVNEYHWGDFRGDVRDFLRRFYDLFVYVANWGTHEFAFRAPAELIDLKAVSPYECDEGFGIHAAGSHVFFHLCSESEDGDDWGDGGGWMASLAPLREEVLSGDLRPLYLGWLAAADVCGFGDDEVEPPVPPGLGSLSAAQRSLADFIRLDDALLTVAARTSPPIAAGADGVAEWIASLPEAEKNDLLTRLCEGQGSHTGVSLRRRFQALSAASAKQPAGQARRSVGELLSTARALVEAREQEEARCRAEERLREEAKAAKARSDYLAKLAQRQPAVWKQIEALVATKQPKKYDEAVGLLRDLKDIAAQSGSREAFRLSLAELRSRHEKKSSFLDRVTAAGLTAG